MWPRFRELAAAPARAFQSWKGFGSRPCVSSSGKDLPPIQKSHPQATAPEVVKRIRAQALEHPAYGCNRMEAILGLEGKRVSSNTVPKILNDHGLGSRHDRWLAWEKANAGKTINQRRVEVVSLALADSNARGIIRRTDEFDALTFQGSADCIQVRSCAWRHLVHCFHPLYGA